MQVCNIKVAGIPALQVNSGECREEDECETGGSWETLTELMGEAGTGEQTGGGSRRKSLYLNTNRGTKPAETAPDREQVPQNSTGWFTPVKLLV